jgi:putative phosphoribosyl transferase
VILVDDGIATGATIIAAAQWIKEEKHSCRKLIVAVPLAPRRDETLDKLNQIADKVIVLYTPIEFGSIGQFYREFDQISDEEVKTIMDRYSHNHQ